MTSGQGVTYGKEVVNYNKINLDEILLKRSRKVDLLVNSFENEELNKAIKYAHIARHSPFKRR